MIKKNGSQKEMELKKKLATGLKNKQQNTG